MSFPKPGRAAFLVALVVGLLLPATVAQATNYWKNSAVTPGNWSTGNNWSSVSAVGVDNAGAPVLNEAVNIVLTDGLAHTVTYDVSAPSLGALSIDSGPGASMATLSMPPGNLNLQANGINVGGYNGAGVSTGRGAIDQSGGTVSTNAGWDLVVGRGANSEGSYTLSGGALEANQSEFIGFNGIGVFSQSGGTNTINGSAVGAFDLGGFAGATGTYNLSGTGALTVHAHEYIGDSGTGIFNQSGGTHTFTEDLYLGYGASPSNGTYNLSAGILTARIRGRENVGYNGVGTFNHTGGANDLDGNDLIVARNPGSTGVYNLSGTGVVRRVDDEYVGYDTFPNGSGTFNQMGGTHTTTNLHLGYAANATGVYNQSGGTNNSQLLYLGEDTGATGIYNQTGGTNTTSDLYIGVYGSQGAYTISGDASLSSFNAIIGLPSLGGTGTLTIRDQAVVNLNGVLQLSQGAVNLEGGTLRIVDYVRGPGGTFNFVAGTVQLAGDRALGTDLIVHELFGSAITTGKNLTVEGIATVPTAVAVNGGVLTVGQLVNAERLQLQRGTLNITNQALTIGVAGPLGATLDVDDHVAVNVTLGITNQGLVTGDGEIGGPFANAGGGELRAEPGRSLKLTGANNTNAGQISLYGGILEFTQDLTNNAGALISGNGTLKATTGLTNDGTMNFAGTANLVGDVINSATGKVISGGGGATIFYDDVSNDGEIRTSINGFTVFFGDVTGSGTFTGTGTVNFEGDLSPGNSPAAASFAGSVGFGPGASLGIELGGLTPGSHYDQVIVTGDLSLGGDLVISLINGFAPSGGQSFNILDWGGLSGAFASLTLPTLGGGLTWNASQLYTTGVLSVAPAFTADFDEDGDVDAADLAQWKGDFGVNGLSDADNDGHSDGADFLAWQRQLGSGPPVTAASAPVPEPTTLVLLILAAAGLCAKFQQLIKT